MNIKIAKYFVPVIAGLILIVTSILNYNFIAHADGQGSDSVCSNTDTSIDPADDESTTPFVSTYDAGTGKAVTGVCIKSGSNMFGGNQHSTLITTNGTIENGCYTISGLGSQILTVTRNNSGSNCQGLSHLDIEIGPSRSASPNPSPNPSPSASPSPSPNTGGLPSPTPATSPSPDPTPSPTTSSSTGGSSNSNSTEGGQVLGISTGPTSLAQTGSLQSAVLLTLGINAIAVGLALRKPL